MVPEIWCVTNKWTDEQVDRYDILEVGDIIDRKGYPT